MPTLAYGAVARLGLLTPQANPTVEAEFAILMPRGATLAVARLTSTDPSPEKRLVAYLERLEATLAQFDALRPQAVGFACTASSYLVPPEHEAAVLAAAEARFGVPILSASAALRAAVARRGAKRIAIVSPYPPALTEAARAYWEAAGFTLTLVDRVEIGSADTRAIYALDAEAARGALGRAVRSGAEAVLLSGTGMPSLPLMREDWGVPVFSSNACLAAALLERVGHAALLDESGFPRGWRERLAEALG